MSVKAQCGACLSHGRLVSPLGAARAAHAQRVLAEESLKVDPGMQVCWECRALVNKSILFSDRVLLAHAAFAAVTNLDHSTSTLHTSTKCGFDYEFSYQDFDLNEIKRNDDDDDKFESGLSSSIWEIPLCPFVGLEEVVDYTPETGIETKDGEDSNKVEEEDPKMKKCAQIKLVDVKKRLRRRRKNFTDEEQTETPDITLKSKVKVIKLSDLTSRVKSKRRRCKDANERTVMTAVTQVRMRKGDRCEKIKTSYLSEEDMLVGRKSDRRGEHYSKSLFKCETCIVGFINSVFLDEHNQSKHSSDAGEYQCDICTVRLPSAASAAAHRRAHYQLHACGDCGFARRQLAEVVRHRAAQHEADRRYKCGECDELFLTVRQRKYHRAKCHRDPLRCPHCAKSFFCRNVYSQHLTLHTGRPLYHCAVCGKSCRGKASLAAHTRTHAEETAEDAYCTACRVQYKSKYIYRQHVKTSLKHVKKEDLKHGCDLCEQRFVTQRDLKRHSDVVHHNNYVHKCDQCERAFGDSTNLKKHILKVHEGVKPAKNKLCEVCNKAFVTNNELARHQLIHTGERPYACDICGATFRQSAALYTHRRLVHLRMRRTERGWVARDERGAACGLPAP